MSVILLIQNYLLIDVQKTTLTIFSPGEVFHKNISKGFYGSYIVICTDSSTYAFEDPLLIKPA